MIERFRRGRRPTLGERVAELLEAASFHRGLALGALIGAAIAGSTIWGRLRGSQRASSQESPTRDLEA